MHFSGYSSMPASEIRGKISQRKASPFKIISGAPQIAVLTSSFERYDHYSPQSCWRRVKKRAGCSFPSNDTNIVTSNATKSSGPTLSVKRTYAVSWDRSLGVRNEVEWKCMKIHSDTPFRWSGFCALSTSLSWLVKKTGSTINSLRKKHGYWSTTLPDWRLGRLSYRYRLFFSVTLTSVRRSRWVWWEKMSKKMTHRPEGYLCSHINKRCWSNCIRSSKWLMFNEIEIKLIRKLSLKIFHSANKDLFNEKTRALSMSLFLKW